MSKAIRLTWDIEWLPPRGLARAIQKAVRDDIRRELRGCARPEDLIFHHVVLTPAEEGGPFVFVYGTPGSDAWHCRYDPGPNASLQIQRRAADPEANDPP